MKIALLLFTLALFSCMSTSKMSNAEQYKQVIKTERIIDTIRILELDTTAFNALLECDSLGQVRIASLKSRDSEISRLKSTLQNNVLDIEVETRTIERIKELIRVDTIYIEKKSEQHERVVIPVSWWKKILMWLGVVFIALHVPKILKRIK